MDVIIQFQRQLCWAYYYVPGILLQTYFDVRIISREVSSPGLSRWRCKEILWSILAHLPSLPYPVPKCHHLGPNLNVLLFLCILPCFSYVTNSFYYMRHGFITAGRLLKYFEGLKTFGCYWICAWALSVHNHFVLIIDASNSKA